MNTKHTEGPYLRNDTTVYALQHAGWRKGEEQFCNRIYANVQRGPGCTHEEAEAVARLFQAAPELLSVLQEVLVLIPDAYETKERALAAISKATGASHVSQQ